MKKFSVSLSNIIKEFSLEILVAGADHNTIKIEVADLNRPGLQLSGFFDYFDSDRIQTENSDNDGQTDLCMRNPHQSRRKRSKK